MEVCNLSNFLSCAQAAEAAHCSELTIKRAVRSGELKAYRPGKGYAIEEDDLTRWIKTKPCRAVAAKKKNPA